jgi:hypothetical protein
MPDTELEPFELVARTTSRSEVLIAQFVDGFAVGWEFAVPEAFREALDIRITSKAISKKTIQVWTQGMSFSFKEGDTLHNSRLAYDDYASFLKGNNPVTIQVQSATDAGYVTKESFLIQSEPVDYLVERSAGAKKSRASSFIVRRQSYDGGSVRLVEYRLSPEKDRMDEAARLEMRQDEFVLLLQKGMHRSCTDDRLITVDLTYGNQHK